MSLAVLPIWSPGGATCISFCSSSFSSSSARVTSVESTKCQWVTPAPIDRTPWTHGSDKNAKGAEWKFKKGTSWRIQLPTELIHEDFLLHPHTSLLLYNSSTSSTVSYYVTLFSRILDNTFVSALDLRGIWRVLKSLSDIWILLSSFLCRPHLWGT